MFLPLKRLFGFLKQDRVFIGVQHTFRFTLNNENNMLLSTNGGFKTELSHASIFIPYVIPSLMTGLMLEKF